METKFVLLEIRRRETTSFFAPGTQGSHNANDFYVKHNILPHTQQHTEESGPKKKKVPQLDMVKRSTRLHTISFHPLKNAETF
jgi:hypothetical protein